MKKVEQKIAQAISASETKRDYLVKPGNRVDIYNREAGVIAEIRLAYTEKSGIEAVCDALDALVSPSKAEGFQAAVILYGTTREKIQKKTRNTAQRAADFVEFFNLPVAVFVCQRDRPGEAFERVLSGVAK